MSILYKGLGDNHKSANIVGKRECSVDEGLKTRGVEKGGPYFPDISLSNKELEGN